MKGIVIKKNSNVFTIIKDDVFFDIPASGKTKKDGIFVGDNVEFDEVITKVEKRKNLLIRPPLANLNKIFIVISVSPKPDFVLVDKILIYCFLNAIQPVLVINKTDIKNENFIEQVEKDYSSFLQIIKVSAKDKIVDEIKNNVDGICALAGQSAVGKSSIINSLFGDNVAQIGNLSKRIERGKQTTRVVQLYKLGNGYLADTAGFSKLDLSMISNLKKEELALYYPDFLKARSKCKYRSCLHEAGECGIISYVKQGKISKRRYENYLKILNELRNSEKY